MRSSPAVIRVMFALAPAVAPAATLAALTPLAACDAGAGAGEGEGEGEGEGAEGEGEGEAAISYVFEQDGAALADDLLDLGTVDASGGGVDVALALRNTGAADFAILSDPPLLVAGADAAFFSVVAQPAALVPAGEAVPFTIRYAPGAEGAHEGKFLFAYGVATEERVLLTVNAATEAPARQQGLRVSVYDGDFDVLPDFDAIEATATGIIAETFDVSARAEGDFFAYLFEGAIDLDTEGSYTFFTVSDDGSRLFIDGALVVDNDGLHGPTEQSGTLALGAGTHEIRVEYFEKAGGATLEVDWLPPGGAREPIPPARLFTN